MTPDDLAADPAALATLYEIAHALLSARDGAQLASRLVHSGLGALGARSGALLVSARGRLSLAFAAGVEPPARGLSLPLDDEARAWLASQGPFALASPGAARALGEGRDRLREALDATWAVGLARGETLLGLLAFGPRLLDGDGRVPGEPWLGALASLAAGALYGRSGSAAAEPRARREAHTLAELRRAHPPLSRLVGGSAALLHACTDLVAIASQPFPALVTGESGVGKELAARALHELSDRAPGPFEIVDCASLPAELIESELFGHVRGAFTGAHRDRRGAFELAHGGTLFLDEIGELPLPLQTRLLRVLQESRFRRVGDERAIEVDVRVVAATNRDLRAEVAAGRFREDLFYRLNVFAVRLPPLRERPDDVGALARHFLARRGEAPALEPDALAALRAHRWPGNVRELANVCAALAVRARGGHVTLADVEAVWRRQYPDAPLPWEEAAADGTGAWVLRALRAARFNGVDAARQLAQRRRAGERLPVGERSALGYYLAGEILRALAARAGDAEAAAREVAGDETLVPRVAGRVREACERLRGARDAGAARAAFAKLPREYEADVIRAWRAVARR